MTKKSFSKKEHSSSTAVVKKKTKTKQKKQGETQLFFYRNIKIEIKLPLCFTTPATPLVEKKKLKEKSSGNISTNGFKHYRKKLER